LRAVEKFAGQNFAGQKFAGWTLDSEAHRGHVTTGNFSTDKVLKIRYYQN
jgi:hypothetical protein